MTSVGPSLASSTFVRIELLRILEYVELARDGPTDVILRVARQFAASLVDDDPRLSVASEEALRRQLRRRRRHRAPWHLHWCGVMEGRVRIEDHRVAFRGRVHGVRRPVDGEGAAAGRARVEDGGGVAR